MGEEMNKMLLVLTVATALFAPVQFLAGVYGMNFVNADGHPTIPELLWPHGYYYFWAACVAWLITSGCYVFCLYRRKRRQIRTNMQSQPDQPTPACSDVYAPLIS